MSETTAPTTGATNKQIEDAIVAILAAWNADINPRTGYRYKQPWSTRLWFKYMRAALDAVLPPAAAVPDAELVAAIQRALEISQLAQGLLLLHGAFGSPWPESELGKRLTAALEAITLPHDWERIAAFLEASHDR